MGMPEFYGVACDEVLAQREDIVAIPGTRRIARLQKNLGDCQGQSTAGELNEIRGRLPQKTARARY